MMRVFTPRVFASGFRPAAKHSLQPRALSVLCSSRLISPAKLLPFSVRSMGNKDKGVNLNIEESLKERLQNDKLSFVYESADQIMEGNLWRFDHRPKAKSHMAE